MDGRAVAGGSGGLHYRKDTRVDCQWIVRKKVWVVSFDFEQNVFQFLSKK